jgi:hypothetical protein
MGIRIGRRRMEAALLGLAGGGNNGFFWWDWGGGVSLGENPGGGRPGQTGTPTHNVLRIPWFSLPYPDFRTSRRSLDSRPCLT